jgi:hypothetical protein
MKYLLKWKMVSPPSEDVRPSRMRDNEEREDKEKYGKVLFPAHMVGNLKGFTIVECSKEQLINRLTLTPWIEYEVFPIIPSGEMWQR